MKLYFSSTILIVSKVITNILTLYIATLLGILGGILIKRVIYGIDFLLFSKRNTCAFRNIEVIFVIFYTFSFLFFFFKIT